MDLTGLENLLEQLTGEPVPFADRLERVTAMAGEAPHELGYSQLNELLLLGGLDRVTKAFFAYLWDGSTEYKPGMAFESTAQLEEGVLRFRKAALLLYGNVKFAFKSLSRDADVLKDELAALAARDIDIFKTRHDPIVPVIAIAPEEAYLTGYLIERDLKERLEANPADEVARALESRRKEVVEQAIRNQAAYLASDHLDVYVATSMRAKHEFIAISRTVKKIFEQDSVRHLKLRWFDPTQAYCSNRIDKGLAEALMLKRASCTIYLAQESDTLGKDSELASTLAQGKPVIAYVPNVDAEYLVEHFTALREADPGKDEASILLEQLRLFEPEAAWTDSTVREWCESPDSAPLTELRERVHARIKKHYDSRAHTLLDSHPLGVQVNLGTGVANGVLVVRNAHDCARVVRGIVTGTLSFKLENASEYTALKESISGSIFRVMTTDPMLTNTFWNFYLNPAD